MTTRDGTITYSLLYLDEATERREYVESRLSSIGVYLETCESCGATWIRDDVVEAFYYGWGSCSCLNCPRP